MATKEAEQTETENPSPGGIPREPYDPTAPRIGAAPAPETVDQAERQEKQDEARKEADEAARKAAEEEAEANKQAAEKQQKPAKKAEK